MKITTKWLISLAGMMIIGFGATAQTNGATYWVVEGNIKSNDYTLIRFYNSDNNLIHEEMMRGKFLDVTNKRDVKFLNKKLRQFDVKTLSVKRPRKNRMRTA
jgi:hypothetical protein